VVEKLDNFSINLAIFSLDSQLGHTKDLKNGICCFSCFNSHHLRVVQRKKKRWIYVSEN